MRHLIQGCHWAFAMLSMHILNCEIIPRSKQKLLYPHYLDFTFNDNVTKIISSLKLSSALTNLICSLLVDNAGLHWIFKTFGGFCESPSTLGLETSFCPNL